jgi:adenylosuccinate lyase
MRAFHEGCDFKPLLLADPDVMRVLSVQEVERAFDLDEQLRHVDHIFERVFERRDGGAAETDADEAALLRR